MAFMTSTSISSQGWRYETTNTRHSPVSIALIDKFTELSCRNCNNFPTLLFYYVINSRFRTLIKYNSIALCQLYYIGYSTAMQSASCFFLRWCNYKSRNIREYAITLNKCKLLMLEDIIFYYIYSFYGSIPVTYQSRRYLSHVNLFPQLLPQYPSGTPSLPVSARIYLFPDSDIVCLLLNYTTVVCDFHSCLVTSCHLC